MGPGPPHRFGERTAAVKERTAGGSGRDQEHPNSPGTPSAPARRVPRRRIPNRRRDHARCWPSPAPARSFTRAPVIADALELATDNLAFAGVHAARISSPSRRTPSRIATSQRSAGWPVELAHGRVVIQYRADLRIVPLFGPNALRALRGLIPSPRSSVLLRATEYRSCLAVFCRSALKADVMSDQLRRRSGLSRRRPSTWYP